MKIRNAFLLLYPLPTWTRSEVPRLLEVELNSPEVSTHLNLYGSDGYLSAVMPHRITPIPMVSPTITETSSVLSAWSSRPNEARHVLIDLRGASVSNLVSHSHQEMRMWRNSLIQNVFQCRGEPDIDRRFLSILYLEPEEILSDIALTRSDYSAIIRQLRVTLRQNDIAAVPQRFHDLFVCHGLCQLPGESDLTVVRNGPVLNLNRDEKYYIADSLFDLADNVALIHFLRSKCEEIDHHPLLVKSPSAYVADLLGIATARNVSMRWLSDGKAAKAYGTHMAARLEGIGAKDSARALAKKYQTASAQFTANAVACDDAWIWQTDTITNNVYRSGIVDGLFSILKNAGDGIEWAAEELAVREQAIGDYFRDYLNAAVAKSNMSLQRTVLLLTVVAIVIALLPFL